MMDFGVIFVLIGGGLLQFFCWWNATRGMINENHINQKFYPKHYTVPSRFIKKFFMIKKQKIPKYLYYMCYATITYFFLGPIELVAFYCADGGSTLAGYMLFIHYSIIFINAIVFLTISTIYKRK